MILLLQNKKICSIIFTDRIDVKDYGNVEYHPVDVGGRTPNNLDKIKLEHFAGCTQILSEQVESVIRSGRKCITLGGDHSIAVGSIDGHIKADKDVGIIWVDAHADINTNSTSSSGNIHGMPVGLLLKELADYWPYLPGMDWQYPELNAKSIAYIGLRDVDSLEKLILEKFNILAFGLREVEVYGIKDVVQRALDQIDPLGTKSIHISFDIDALDTLEAPSTGTAVRGGLSLREGIYIMEEVFRTGRLTAVDLVEVNPSIGNDRDVQTTVKAAIHLLAAACGHNRTGNLPMTNEIPFHEKITTDK